MATSGETQWPPVWRTHGHQWGQSKAVDGENPKAIDSPSHPHEVEYLLHASAGVDESAFFADATLQRAFIRSLEVIGEATKRLPLEFRLAHPEVDWRGMAGLRDRLIHGYFGVDLELVWDVVRPRIPALGQVLGMLVAGEDG
jgi:uncharacterized protein with HEPN domain